MVQTIPDFRQLDSRRAARWRALRRKIGTCGGSEQRLLLRSLSDEIRAIALATANASTGEWDPIGSQELATPLGILVGAWLNAEPANPAWPSRDRLFLARQCDLVAACSALALAGFFPPEHAAGIVDAAAAGAGRAEIPGLDAVTAPPEAKAAMAWESALESGRSKRRWREFFAPDSGPDWVAPAWLDEPFLWRTCFIADAGGEGMTAFRDMAGQDGEAPAGLVAILVANRALAAATAQEWREAGWKTAVVDSADGPGLYRALTAPAGDCPVAIALDLGRGRTTPSGRFAGRVDAAKLLGEMSDEQFNAVLGESLDF